MSAPDPRNEPNFAPWIVFIIFVLLVNIFRNMGKEFRRRVRGWDRPVESMPGVQRGGAARDAIAPPSTTFKDVAGVDEAKEELPRDRRHSETAGKVRSSWRASTERRHARGAPGTGKTLLARAVAGEAGCRSSPSQPLNSSSSTSVWARRAFACPRRAAAQSPSIVFIDEIDAVAKSRGDGKMRGMGNDEREQTLNQLLTELDGFRNGVNGDLHSGDEPRRHARFRLRRPGRFDRTISVDRPDKQGRREILAVHTTRRERYRSPKMRVSTLSRR